jgi:amino acid adenylation domain-containing protein
VTASFVAELYAHAARDPHRTALVSPEGTVSYRELTTRIDRLAGALAGAGLGPERVCAVAVERGADAVVAMAAVLRAGGAFLTLDAGSPAERLAAMVRGAGAGLAVTTAALAQRLRLPVDGPTLLLDRPATADQSTAAPATPAPATPAPAIASDVPAGPRSLAYVSHTSGSTGTPNAVLIERRGLESYLRSTVRAYGLGPDTVAVQLAPLGYDASIRDVFAPLLAGGKLVTLPRSAQLRADEFTAALREFDVDTILSVTPTFLTFLARQEHRLDLRLVLSSGESLRPFLTMGGRRAVTGTLVNQYGPTECTMTSTRYEVPAEPDLSADLIGTPIDGVTVRLLGPDLCPVPDGEVGEVHIGGIGVARGYGGRPGLTADRFLPDPFDGTSGARMYRTGDLARRRPDGVLELLGRSDRQIKIRGYRVDPAEVEGALLAHPSVTGAVVVPQDDERGGRHLVAHVSGPLSEVTDAQLRALLMRTLPFHMVPRRFVRLARIPTTTSGKADRAALGTAAGAPR